jgi:hypothetical protein
MDSRTFDSLTKTLAAPRGEGLAAPRSRRHALVAFGGALLGVTLAGLRAEPAEAAACCTLAWRACRQCSRQAGVRPVFNCTTDDADQCTSTCSSCPATPG